MAIGALLQTEAGTRNGDNYRITIYQDGFVGTVTSFTAAVPIFELDYQPSTDDIAGNLSPSVCSIYAMNESGSLNTFINNFLDYQESNQYTVLIERDSGSGYYDYWRGILIQDTFQSEDRSGNVVQVFRAVDGLAALKFVDYEFFNSVTTEPGNTPIKDMILNCLTSGITTDLWGASDSYLITSVDWWEDSQTYGALTDPLVTQVSDNRSFLDLKLRDDGLAEIEFQSCFDVLQQLARVYLANVYMADGAYIFEQIPLRENQTVKQVRYSKSGTLLGATIPNKALTISKNLDSARLAGNIYDQFPALKRVEVEMAAYGSGFDNLITLDASIYTDNQTKEFGFFDKDIGNIIGFGVFAQRLQLNVDFKVAADWAYTTGDIVKYSGSALKGWVGIRPTCNCQIKLNDVASTTDYYWNGSSWVTTPTGFTLRGADVLAYVTASVSSNLSYRPTDNVTLNITTTNLPVTGNVDITLNTFRWEYYSAISPPTWTQFLATDPDVTNESGTVELQLSTKFSRGSTVRLFAIDNSDTKIEAAETLKYPDLQLRDGSVGTGCIFIFDGSNYVRGINWRIANGSEDIALGALIAKQRLEIQRSVQERYSGRVLYGLGYNYSIVFDGKVWRPMNYSFSAYYNEVNGTWVSIGVVPETVSNPTEKNPVLGNYAPNATIFGKYGGGFRIAGNSLAENLLNNIWYDDGEELGGSSTSFFMQKGQRNNYLDIKASNGTTSSADISDTIIKFRWTGSDGTHDLEIPDAADMDGGLLEIILDNTFSASTNVDIIPATGNIQGSTSKTINGANTRIVIRAINGNWF